MTARDPIFAELDRLIAAGLGDIPREPLRPLTERESEIVERVQVREFVRRLHSERARKGSRKGWDTRRRRMRERMGRTFYEDNIAGKKESA